MMKTQCEWKVQMFSITTWADNVLLTTDMGTKPKTTQVIMAVGEEQDRVILHHWNLIFIVPRMITSAFLHI